MKKNWKELVYGISFVLIFGGLFFWVVITRDLTPLMLILGVSILMTGLITFIYKMVTNRNNISTGQPPEDEFSKLAKVYAGNQAFHYSMYLWMIIFFFNDSFTKNETMLGIGILGSALLYGLFLWYKKSTGDIYA
jgi:ABC-type uncharacterized transport system permease subunit